MAQQAQSVRRGLLAVGTPALGIKPVGLSRAAEGVQPMGDGSRGLPIQLASTRGLSARRDDVPPTWEDDGGAPEGGRYSTRPPQWRR